MDRPTKKEIKAAVDKLKGKADNQPVPPEHSVGQVAGKKSHRRIGVRKQGT